MRMHSITPYIITLHLLQQHTQYCMLEQEICYTISSVVKENIPVHVLVYLDGIRCLIIEKPNQLVLFHTHSSVLVYHPCIWSYHTVSGV